MEERKKEVEAKSNSQTNPNKKGFECSYCRLDEYGRNSDVKLIFRSDEVVQIRVTPGADRTHERVANRKDGKIFVEVYKRELNHLAKMEKLFVMLENNTQTFEDIIISYIRVDDTGDTIKVELTFSENRLSKIRRKKWVIREYQCTDFECNDEETFLPALSEERDYLRCLSTAYQKAKTDVEKLATAT